MKITIYVTEKIIWGINDILLEFLQMCFACFELVNVANEHEAFQMFNGYSIYLEYFFHGNPHTKRTTFWPTKVRYCMISDSIIIRTNQSYINLET